MKSLSVQIENSDAHIKTWRYDQNTGLSLYMLASQCDPNECVLQISVEGCIEAQFNIFSNLLSLSQHFANVKIVEKS